MASLSLTKICKQYGDLRVLDDIDLQIADGEFVVFVGPSGCGKSTLLRSIAGLEEISSGELRIGGQRMNEQPPSKRGLAMVFQSYALYPHMTVAENMSFALRLAGQSKAEIEAGVQRAAAVLQIEHLLHRRPAQLSGGQRQRVAIGRAIVRQPGIFLFDEPLSNLDAALRTQTRLELAKLHQELGTTMLYVTHDQAEAMTLADRIVVFNRGRIEQVGTPMELYRRPANRFVASFLGSPAINFLPALALPQAGGLQLVLTETGADGLGLLHLPLQVSEPSQVSLGLRPECLHLAPANAGGLQGLVQLVEHMGDVSYVHVALPSGTVVCVRASADPGCGPGSSVCLQFKPQACLVFDSTGQALQAPAH